MKEVHLTNASIPGVRCLREMKASTNKRRRETTYTMIAKTIITQATHLNRKLFGEYNIARKGQTIIGNEKAIPVRVTEQTRHSIASSLEGNMKNHPRQCIPPNTVPTTPTTKVASGQFISLYSVGE